MVRMYPASFPIPPRVSTSRHRNFHLDASQACNWTVSGTRFYRQSIERCRAGHKVAVRLLYALQRSSLVWLTHTDSDPEAEARLWLQRHCERRYSFVDAVSFEVMHGRQIPEALAFNRGFAAAGCIEVRSSKA